MQPAASNDDTSVTEPEVFSQLKDAKLKPASMYNNIAIACILLNFSHNTYSLNCRRKKLREAALLYITSLTKLCYPDCCLFPAMCYCFSFFKVAETSTPFTPSWITNNPGYCSLCWHSQIHFKLCDASTAQ